MSSFLIQPSVKLPGKGEGNFQVDKKVNGQLQTYTGLYRIVILGLH